MKLKIILLIGIVMVLIGCNREQNINFDDLSVDTETLENLKYKIHIDCEWVKEHINDTTVWFPNETMDLCKYVFPDLFS